MESWESEENEEGNAVVIDSEMDGVPLDIQPSIKRKMLNSNYPRLLIIEKYTPKLLGENLHSFCLLKL